MVQEEFSKEMGLTNKWIWVNRQEGREYGGRKCQFVPSNSGVNSSVQLRVSQPWYYLCLGLDNSLLGVKVLFCALNDVYQHPLSLNRC